MGQGWEVAGKGECLTGEGTLELDVGGRLGFCQARRGLSVQKQQLSWVLFLALLGRSDLQAGLAKPLCWAGAYSSLPTVCGHEWGQLMKRGAALTHMFILLFLASSRKGTPHSASPPEVML